MKINNLNFSSIRTSKTNDSSLFKNAIQTMF